MSEICNGNDIALVRQSNARKLCEILNIDINRVVKDSVRVQMSDGDFVVATVEVFMTNDELRQFVASVAEDKHA